MGGRAKLDYDVARKVYKFYSHIPNVQPIKLNAEQMQLVCKVQERMKGRFNDLVSGVYETPRDNCVLHQKVIASEPPTYQTRMELSKNKGKPFIWLKTFVRPKDSAREIAPGGCILNDVDPEELQDFVDVCTVTTEKHSSYMNNSDSGRSGDGKKENGSHDDIFEDDLGLESLV